MQAIQYDHILADACSVSCVQSNRLTENGRSNELLLEVSGHMEGSIPQDMEGLYPLINGAIDCYFYPIVSGYLVTPYKNTKKVVSV